MSRTRDDIRALTDHLLTYIKGELEPIAEGALLGIMDFLSPQLNEGRLKRPALDLAMWAAHTTEVGREALRPEEREAIQELVNTVFGPWGTCE